MFPFSRLSSVVAVTVLSSACATASATINSYVDPTYSKGGIESIACLKALQ